MITPKLKKKYEKLILELRYLTADYDYHRMLYQDSQIRFAEAFEQYVAENNLITAEERILKTGEIGDDPEDEFTELEPVEDERQRKRINAVANAVYKKIAKATHPDKIMHMTEEEQERRRDMFQDAQDASNKREWYRLLCIATDLGISLPTPSKEHITLLETKNKELRQTIISMNKTYAMVYNKMPNEASKKNLFKEFAKATGYTTLD
ncbi:MAG: hypothetical protein CMB48_03595 [Euryarchaeota archaeon]|nr:hypothetical protein [Euryarchaeota archaeon]